MDDMSITDHRLYEALRDLRWTNRLLGGYASTRRVLAPVMDRHSRLRILDVGTGGGDSLVDLVRFGHSRGCRVEAVGIDLNPGAVEYAQRYLDQHLSERMRQRITVETGDALKLSYDDDSFDVALSSLFLHHFDEAQSARVVGEMARVSRKGVLVNDLHRHPLAYLGVLLLSRLLPASDMYRHDAPLSVRRGFRRRELASIASRAGIQDIDIRWHWAFRWTLFGVTN